MQAYARRPFKTAVPYAGDAMSLPVHNLEDALRFYENIMGFRIVSREGAGSLFENFRTYGIFALIKCPSVIEAFAIPQTKVFSQVAASMHFLNWVIPSRQREQGGRSEDFESARTLEIRLGPNGLHDSR